MLRDDLRMSIVNNTTDSKKIKNFWGKINEQINQPDWWTKNIPFSSPNIGSRDATDGKLFIFITARSFF